MVKKINNFFSLLKFEFVRIFRNKLFFVFLTGFSIVFLAVMILTQNSFNNVVMAVYTHNYEYSEINSVEIIEDIITKEEPIIVNSLEEGKDLLLKNKALIFIDINPEVTPEKITIYLNDANFNSSVIKQTLSDENTRITNEKIIQLLNDYGIRLRPNYLNSVSIESFNEHENARPSFSTEMALVVSIILMLGVVFSVSRDHETEAYKTLKYTPISKFSYLFTKLVAYILVGLFNILIFLLAGMIFFKINFQINILVILAVSILFIVASISLGFITSMIKDQVSATVMAIVLCTLPQFALVSVNMQGLSLFLQIFMYAFPYTSYVYLVSGMIVNGYVGINYLLILLAECIIYLTASFLVLHFKTKN